MNKNQRKRYNKSGSTAGAKQKCKPGEIEVRPETEKLSEESGNHIQWYVPDQNLLTDVASIPFNYRVGDDMPVKTTSTNGTDFTQDTYVEPGVMAIRFTPSYGDLDTPTSAGNVASQAVYSWVRHANSGSRNYDSPDLMLYLLAMDSVYMGITWCQRLISYVMAYSRDTRYTPQALVNAMGVQWSSDLVGSLPAMRSRLNQMILKATTLAVPRALPIYERHSFMCANVYCDDTWPRTQFYIFNPDYLWKFSLDEEQKGQLRTIEFGVAGTTTSQGWSAIGQAPWSTFFSAVEGCINAIYADEDAGIMSGDILKAYGKENLFQLVTVPDDVMGVPIYDAEMLEQIHNAFALGATSASTIVQEIPEPSTGLGPYLHATYVSGFTATAGMNRILDLHMDLTPANVMRATRLMGGVSYSTAGVLGLKGVATEYVNFFVIIRRAGATFTGLNYVSNPVIMNNTGSTGVYKPDALEAVIYNNMFFRAPILYPRYAQEATASTPLVSVPTGEQSQSTVISAEQWKKLNDVAMLGCFNVPRLTLGYLENA